MKNLLLSLCLLAFMAITSNAVAQSTGINPNVGDAKTYSVTAHTGNTYTWTLEASATGGGTNLIGTGTSAVAVATGSTSGVDVNSIELTWVNPTIGTIYYLHVIESDGSCMNRKVLAIQPANNFKLDIVNVLADGSAPTGTGETTDYSVCAPTIPNTISWNGTDPVTVGNATDFNYDYGTSTFYYKVTASGINFATTSWDAVLDFTKAGGANAAATVEYFAGASISGSTTWVSSTFGANTTVSNVSGNTLWIKVTVANKIGTATTANENTADNDITVALDATSKENATSNVAVSLGNGSTVQTQKARPTTSVISY